MATGVTHLGGYSNPTDTGTVFINQTYPTLTTPSTTATTVIDGTVVWTAINPDGQGFNSIRFPRNKVLFGRSIRSGKIVFFSSLI